MHWMSLCVRVIFPHYFFGTRSTMYQWTQVSWERLLSQQSVRKCLLLLGKQPYHYTSHPENPLCNALQAFLKGEDAMCGALAYPWCLSLIREKERCVCLLETEKVSQWVIKYLPAAGLGRLNRLVWPSLTDACQCDTLWWLLLFSSAQGPVQVYGPVLVDTHICVKYCTSDLSQACLLAGVVELGSKRHSQ